MRIEQLTFTRFIAAIAIVFFHFGKPLNIFSEPHVNKLLINANIGVSYFFILSGFVMMIAYGNKSNVHPVSYMQNRFARIYPVYFLAIILALLYKTFLVKENYTIQEIGLNIFALQSWIPAKALSVNFPGWSLSVEFFFYAIFPFVFNFFYTKFSTKQLLVPILTFWGLSQVLFLYFINTDPVFSPDSRVNNNFLIYFPINHLNEFLVGNLTGLYFIKAGQDRFKNYDWAVTLLFILILLAIVIKLSWLSYHNGLLAVLFIPFILLTALNNGKISTIFSHKIPVYLGEISYGIYILQVPVFMTIKFLLNKVGITGDLVIFVIGILGLLIVSALSYELIETPLREKIKKIRFQFYTKTQ